MRHASSMDAIPRQLLAVTDGKRLHSGNGTMTHGRRLHIGSDNSNASELLQSFQINFLANSCDNLICYRALTYFQSGSNLQR